MSQEKQGQPGRQDQQANNKRTGLILASVALAFFCGILARKLLLG